MPSSMNLWSGNVVIFWRRMKFCLKRGNISSIFISSIVLIPEFKLGQIISSELELEMDSTGYPDDNNFFEFGYCGHTQFPHSNIFLDQASDLILSQF